MNNESYYSGNMSICSSMDAAFLREAIFIEAVVVCYNYGDFLEYTLPRNLDHLDRLVVVTHPSDRKTIQVCNKYGVDCIKTEVFHEDGDVFNKGRAINLGLSHLRHTGWIIQMDADILLPPRFRFMLKMAKMNRENIYGCDRLNTITYENWVGNHHKTIPQFAWRYIVRPHSDFPIGARLVHLEYGWCPLGFFQVWHASMRRQYPVVCGSAEHSDVLFAVQWPRENRILLPEFFVYHLESEKVDFHGNNWRGRITKVFGPDSGETPPERVNLAKAKR